MCAAGTPGLARISISRRASSIGGGRFSGEARISAKTLK
jgi:hypothetical protein